MELQDKSETQIVKFLKDLEKKLAIIDLALQVPEEYICSSVREGLRDIIYDLRKKLLFENISN